jgi:hypothetical protein
VELVEKRLREVQRGLEKLREVELASRSLGC